MMKSLLYLSCLRTFEFRTPLGTSLLLIDTVHILQNHGTLYYVLGCVTFFTFRDKLGMRQKPVSHAVQSLNKFYIMRNGKYVKLKTLFLSVAVYRFTGPTFL